MGYNETLKNFLEDINTKKVDLLEFNKFMIVNNKRKKIDLEKDFYKVGDPELEKYYNYDIDVNLYIDDDLNTVACIRLLKSDEMDDETETYEEHYNSFHADLYDHAKIINGNLQFFREKDSTTPSARFNIECVYHTKLTLKNGKFPVLRVAWYWDDDRDMNFLEVSPKNPQVADVFELLEFQKNINMNHTENVLHKYRNKLIGE
jgi:hypothetical protein